MHDIARHTPAALPFPLLDDVIVVADAAMRARDPQKIVTAMVRGLRGAIAVAGALPPALLVAVDGAYTRRELFVSPTFGYQILAITWPAGQGSSVHDHADTWGVEAVLRGRLDVVDYRVANRDNALTALRPSGSHSLVDGQVLGLLPPHDVHSCHNTAARETAVSLHIYGTPLTEVRRFVHVEGELYRPERVRLASA